ncbi:MAG: DUF6273 domain-containing protein [Oscillospiraceae bacterium]|nr:DUF6273 domain-containing protein [Oscillospiraceae bacterium]
MEIIDDPCARILLFYGTANAAILVLEIAQTPSDLVAQLKRLIQERTGISEENVWIVATHQFGFMHRPSDNAGVDMFNAAVLAATENAVAQALAVCQPCRICVGYGVSHVSANKNVIPPEGLAGVENTCYYAPGGDGPSDPAVTMLRFEALSDGHPIGFYMYCCAKPSVLCITGKHAGNRQLNSELTGQACKWVEQYFGAPCVFCMPTAGDQYPRETAMYYGVRQDGTWGMIDNGFERGIEIVDRLGAELGTDCIRAAEFAKPMQCGGDVRLGETSFDWPNRTGDGTVRVDIDAIALGEQIAFLGFKQEVDCLLGLSIRQHSPYRITLPASFVNGDGKYMVAADAYHYRNGIGTWEAKRTPFATGAGEEFVRRGIELLQVLRNGSHIRPKQARASAGSYVGGTVELGGCNWTILAVEGTSRLLLCDCIVEERAYHAPGGAVTWETSEVRAYLNGAWLEKTFSAKEREMLLETKLQNPSNPKYGTAGGNATRDHVFLLSLEEAEKYLAGFDHMLVSTNLSRQVGWWYLRSPGEAADVAACVTNTGEIDYHGVDGGVANPTGGLRPAIWIK